MYTATLTIDQDILHATAVNLPSELNARQLLEVAFVQLQSDSELDPFLYEIEYYGYSQPVTGFTSYLGYEIESIGGYVNGDSDNYWMLYVNGAAATVGIDSYLVQPNDEIALQYINFGAVTDKAAASRLQQINARRASRTAQRASQ